MDRSAIIFFAQIHFNSCSRNGAICVSSTSFGPKSAPKAKVWGKMVKGRHHEGRLTLHHKGHLPLVVGLGAPRGGAP